MRSKGIFLKTFKDKPKRTFIQLLKKKVGPKRYNKTSKKSDNRGNKSKKKLKNRNSAIKKIDPGNPKNIKQFSNDTKKSFGHKKLIALISVIKRVLKRLLIASTNKKELVDNKA